MAMIFQSWADRDEQWKARAEQKGQGLAAALETMERCGSRGEAVDLETSFVIRFANEPQCLLRGGLGGVGLNGVAGRAKL